MRTCGVWSDGDQTILRQIWASDIPTHDAPDEYHRLTGHRRTEKALKARAQLLKILRPAHVIAAARSVASKKSVRASKTATVWQHPDSLAYAEVVWTTTSRPSGDIAAELNWRFGMELTGDRVADHARKRGWHRPEGTRGILARTGAAQVSEMRAAEIERAALTRLEKAPVVVERRGLVPPGTFPAPIEGFSMFRAR